MSYRFALETSDDNIVKVIIVTKLSIGGLIGVQVSSIDKWAIRTILSLFIFFKRKDFTRIKTLTTGNQLTKQK